MPVQRTLDIKRTHDVGCFTDQMKINCCSDSIWDAQKGCVCEHENKNSQIQNFFACFGVQFF